MSKETLKLLLEALGYVLTPDGGTRAHVWDSDEARFVVQAYKVVEEALAKQEQGEPVACQSVSTEMLKFLNGEGPLDGVWFGETHPTERGAYWWRKRLNTTPQQRKPLTDEEIATVYWGATGQSLRPQDNVLAHKFARAIEAAHGIKE